MLGVTLSLQDILNEDKESLLKLQSNLSSRGYCFVTLPSDIVDQVQKLKGPLTDFFSDTCYNKDDLYGLGLYGYASRSHKQSLHYLTGSEFKIINDHYDKEAPIPIALQELETIVRTVDRYLLKLAQVAAPVLFNCDAATLGNKYKIPFLTEKRELANVAMFDVAWYNNDEKNPAWRPPMNCVAHYDPGLFSLSFLQTEPGLQLQDETGAWINGPSPDQPDVGLIWAGQAAVEASENKIKAGIHQVVYPNEIGKPRMSMWAEICTLNQLFPASLPFFNKDTQPPDMRKVACNKLIVKNFIGGEDFSVPVKEGKLVEALHLVELLLGLPYSKIIREPVYDDNGDVLDCVQKIWTEQ